MHSEERPNPDRSLESLETRLRAVPEPTVPANLEARLLAAIPVTMPFQPRRWPVRVGVVGAVAAACLVTILAWPRHEELGTGGEGRLISEIPSPAPAVSEKAMAWREARQLLDGGEIPGFSWPLEETTPITASNSIPADLLK